MTMAADYSKSQHELHLWIYYMCKFLNTSEFIIQKKVKKMFYKFKKLDFQKS